MNLRDCLSHFDLKKLILQMSLFFLCITISSVKHPTGSNGRSAKKRDCFSPYEKMISQLSLCLPLAAVSYKRLVTTSGKKEINSLAQQTICLRTLNEQTLMRKSLCVY